MRLVQSALIGENVRILTGILGCVADSAAVGVAAGAVWLAEHCVCSAVGAAAVSATCVLLGRACPGALAGLTRRSVGLLHDTISQSVAQYHREADNDRS